MEVRNILTGDRPTGKLHLGHYVGSLASRLEFQNMPGNQLYVMIADMQALTDCYDEPSRIVSSVRDVMCDYLAVGLDPAHVVFFIQSQVRELTELTMYFMNLVSVNRLERNPTVKAEIQQKRFSDSIPAGFLCYPISQAADITAFRAEIVPVGEDQAPLIEQTNEIVRKFNRLYNTNCLKEVKPVFGHVPRLVGIDGQNKASKSLNNTIFLSDSAEAIKSKIYAMYTDPYHISINDPGNVEGNVVFQYLDAFCDDVNEVRDLKARYTKGGVGDIVIKSLLNDVLQKFLAPIRERREYFIDDRNGVVENILHNGIVQANKVVGETMRDVRNAIGIDKYCVVVV